MCRSRRIQNVLLLLLLAVCCSACGGTDKLITDTGSSGQKEISREEYLNVDALSTQAGQTLSGQYKIYTLQTGTFEETALNQTISRVYINTVAVRLETEEKYVRMGEYKANYMEYVEAGDVIATIYVERDEIAIEEAELKVSRLKEKLAQAEADMQKELAEQEKQKKELIAKLEKEGEPTDGSEVKIMDIRYQQSQLSWEYERQGYEQEIQDAEEALAKLKGKGDFFQITAPVAGYVIYDMKYVSDCIMEDGYYICDILADDTFYAGTDKQGELFGFGMPMTFTTLTGEVTGRVISGGTKALYGNLNTGQTVFALDYEGTNTAGIQTNNQSFVMKGNIRTVDNVVLVPKQAVTVADGEYFVTVLKEDGSLLKTEFIPGGSNDTYFWVWDGLTEGMQIIYK